MSVSLNYWSIHTKVSQRASLVDVPERNLTQDLLLEGIRNPPIYFEDLTETEVGLASCSFSSCWRIPPALFLDSLGLADRRCRSRSVLR